MDLYAENILDHYRNPRSKRSLESCTIKHEEANHSCGDVLSVELLLKEDAITEIGWSGTGCAISQAAMSILSEELIGRTSEEILGLSKDDIYTMLGVPIGPRRMKCALLCLHTLKNAIRTYKHQEPAGWLDTVDVA